MQQPNFSGVRILIAGANGYAAALLRTVLAACGIVHIDVVDDARHALEMLRGDNYDALFVEERVELDGAPFVVAARRAPSMPNPMIPIFVVSSGARRRDVEKSRDLGIHDVIVRPVSPKTIMEKLHAALTMPRPFIAAPDFFGPDRRSKMRVSAPFRGSDRRVRIPKKQKIQVIDN